MCIHWILHTYMCSAIRHSASLPPPHCPSSPTVTAITAKWRMYILRKKYRQLREAQIVFSKHWKRILTQRMAQRYRQAAVVVRK